MASSLQRGKIGCLVIGLNFFAIAIRQVVTQRLTISNTVCATTHSSAWQLHRSSGGRPSPNLTQTNRSGRLTKGCKQSESVCANLSMLGLFAIKSAGCILVTCLYKNKLAKSLCHFAVNCHPIATRSPFVEEFQIFCFCLMCILISP